MERQIKNELSTPEQELIDIHKKGGVSRESLVLLQKLFVEAKLRLKKSHIKLPIHHFAALSALFKDQLKKRMLHNKEHTGQQTGKEKLQSKINDLQDKGIIREIKTVEELEELNKSDAPRISINVDSEG
jgi:hypothetical protein